MQKCSKNCNIVKYVAKPEDTFLLLNGIIIAPSTERPYSRWEMMARDRVDTTWAAVELVSPTLACWDITSMFDQFLTQIHVSFQLIWNILRFCVNLTVCVRFSCVSYQRSCYQDDLWRAPSETSSLRSLSLFLSLCLRSLMCYCSHR